MDLNNKKEAAPEVPVKEQSIQLTVNVTNLNELEQLILDINEKLNQLNNFKLQIEIIDKIEVDDKSVAVIAKKIIENLEKHDPLNAHIL